MGWSSTTVARGRPLPARLATDVDEPHPVHRRGPCRSSAARALGDVALVVLKSYSGQLVVNLGISRSRVTLASTDAAATHAATRSPFQTARPRHPEPVDGEPVGEDVLRRPRAAPRARRNASTLATCMPSRSHSSCRSTTTDHARARAHDLVVAAVPRLLGQQLRVGQTGHDRRPCPPAGWPPPPPAEAGAGPPPRLVHPGHQVDAVAAQRPLVAVEPCVTPYRPPPGSGSRSPGGAAGGAGDRRAVGATTPQAAGGGTPAATRRRTPCRPLGRRHERARAAVRLAGEHMCTGGIGGVGAVVAHHEHVPSGTGPAHQLQSASSGRSSPSASRLTYPFSSIGTPLTEEPPRASHSRRCRRRHR